VSAKHFRSAKPLAPGARVALIAPAGPLQKDDELPRAIENTRALGWDPIVGENARQRLGYLAGDDRARLDDVNRALADPSVDALWCLRGGYGMIRILDGIDYHALETNPKPIIGYSDITAFHAAVQRKCWLVSYHGPTAREALTPFSRDSLERAVVAQTNSCGRAAKARTVVGGKADGRLAGGNLAVLASLCGTPYAPDLTDCILVLEDINEPVYRIDRLLQQLKLSGILRGCKAIAFGECVKCGDDASPNARSLDEVLGEIAGEARVPCVAGIPVGHIAEQWTIPLGAMATLDADACTLDVANFAS
jgi:muramoyltetrapeptide carboxypeptidase